MRTSLRGSTPATYRHAHERARRSFDLATLTLAHEEHLGDVIAGYGSDVIRAYWSLRSLMEIRWLVEHGHGAPATFPEVAVLNSLSASS